MSYGAGCVSFYVVVSQLVLWFKDGQPLPVYSYDARYPRPCVVYLTVNFLYKHLLLIVFCLKSTKFPLMKTLQGVCKEKMVGGSRVWGSSYLSRYG